MSWDELIYELSKVLGDLLEEVARAIRNCLIGCAIVAVIGLIFVAWLATAHPEVLIGILVVISLVVAVGAMAAQEGQQTTLPSSVEYYQIEPAEPERALAAPAEPAKPSRESVQATIARLQAEEQEALRELKADIYRYKDWPGFDAEEASRRMQEGARQIKNDLYAKIAEATKGQQ